MSFSKNGVGIVRIDDPILYLTKAQTDYLKKSWAGYFYENIFKEIDEARFAVLFKDGKGRYNSPINETVGMILIKELFGYSDKYVLNESALDLRYKFAVGCTHKQGSPVKPGTLSKFRRKLRDYKKSTGKDLLAEEMADRAEAIEKFRILYVK